LAACGATIHFQKLKIKPGRPTLFASLPDGTLVFAMPGNPISTFVGFELLVRPALAALEGRPQQVPHAVQARLEGTVAATTDRRSYWPARVLGDSSGEWVAKALPWKGSGDPFGMASANALIMRPPKAPAASTGDRVLVLLLGWN
jgi:molybdopterin molybdotransferase